MRHARRLQRESALQNRVGVERFELLISSSQSKRATRLRHTPRVWHLTPSSPARSTRRDWLFPTRIHLPALWISGINSPLILQRGDRDLELLHKSFPPYLPKKGEEYMS